MTAQRLMAAIVIAAFICPTVVQAQGAFPAPLPGQAPAPSASPFPPINNAPAAAPAAPRSDDAFSRGAAPVGGNPMSQPMPQQSMSQPQGGGGGGPTPEQQKCSNDFSTLKAEAEKRAKVIQGLSQRKAPASEACKAIGSFSQAESKMLKFVETNAQRCGIPPQLGEQMRKGHTNTENMQAKICNVAQQQNQQGAAGPSLSEALGGSALPEASPAKRYGGSTFDTLNGNVLAR